MRWRRSHIGSQLGTQTLSWQSSHSGQLATHRHRSPGRLQPPSALQLYGVGLPLGMHTPGPQFSQSGQAALHAQTRSCPHELPVLSQRHAWVVQVWPHRSCRPSRCWHCWPAEHWSPSQQNTGAKPAMH